MSKNSGPIKELKYCRRCCIPETQEGVEFDELGICRPCSSSEDKMRIDWNQKEKELRMRDAGEQQDMIKYADKSKDAYKIN